MDYKTVTIRLLNNKENILRTINSYIEDFEDKFEIRLEITFEFHDEYEDKDELENEIYANIYDVYPEQFTNENLKHFLSKILFKNSRVFLDDERKRPNQDFILLRSFEEFKDVINSYGIPAYISFDHDLGLGKTGFDCAKFLVDYCLDKDLKLPAWKVHSQNPVGKENFEKLLEGFKKFQNK